MLIFGYFILLLAILMDDLTTHIILLKGFSVVESNPIYRAYGYFVFVIVSMLIYLFLFKAWKFVVNKYVNFYENKKIMYKFYDVFVFFFCLMLVFVSTGKILVGIHNIQFIGSYLDEDQRIEMEQQIAQLEDLKQNNNEEYQQFMDESYNDNVHSGISYFQFIFNSLLAYILFRLGNKVSPWEAG